MNVMTIDVEDWYHCLDENPSHWQRYEDRIVPAVRRILEVLSVGSTTATFFVLGHVAERHPDLVEEIAAHGHEIGSHGYEHRFVYCQSASEFECDVVRSIERLQSIVSRPVRSYRAPYFSVTRQSLWALPILKRLGIKYDSSIFPVINHRYGIPGARREPHSRSDGLIEVPPSTYRIARLNIPISGGVYFRFFPYPILKGLLRRHVQRGIPIVFYLHPWELDDEHPRITLPMARKLRHYWGLSSTERKLRALATDFKFGAIRDVFEA